MNLQKTIRKVLREETNFPISMRRRLKPIFWPEKRHYLNPIDHEIDRLVSKVYTPNKICNYIDANELIEVIIYACAENLYYNTFYDINDQSEEWEIIFQSLSNYIRDKYGDKIREYYKHHC
jgi:hypothetical protein